LRVRESLYWRIPRAFRLKALAAQRSATIRNLTAKYLVLTTVL